MKKRIMGVALGLVVGASMLAGGASAGVCDNANSNACFGQGRAAFASTYKENGPPSNGYYISQRKGDNPEVNADCDCGELPEQLSPNDRTQQADDGRGYPLPLSL